jgi:Right handed beta helix region
MSKWKVRLVAPAVIGLAIAGVTAIPQGVYPAFAACTTYFVSPTGSDSNTGCSSTTAWQTLAKVNATTFTAGITIDFQKGGSWTGELHPLGSGSNTAQNWIGSYGSGAAPIIAGNGAAAAIYLDNQSYWTINNLEITNTTSTAAVRSGIQIQNDTSGVVRRIHIENNNIHNVLGLWTSGGPQPSTSSGIAFNLSDSFSTNNWDDVVITGNTLTADDAGGIYIGSLAGTGHSITSTNIVISNNTLTNMGGNDIVCVYCASPVVSNNVASASGSRYSGAGLWTALSTNGIWEYNEVSTQTRHGSDGEAFDIDHGTVGTILEYNYSHSNAYGFQEYCCGSSTGAQTSTVRYNISQNDGASNTVLPHQAYVGTGSTAKWYNNVLYLSSTDNASITNDVANSGITYSNNIIYKLGTGTYGTGGTWTHNVFFGNHPASEPADSSKLTSDPLFVSPGSAGSGRSSASGYKLKTGSPAINSGVLISSNGGLDYFGNAVSSTAAPDRGAYNGAPQ